MRIANGTCGQKVIDGLDGWKYSLFFFYIVLNLLSHL